MCGAVPPLAKERLHMGGRENSSLKTWMFLALLRKEVMPAFTQ
jgi:hypothetical protein